MREHTPTPWSVRDDECLKIQDASGNMIGMISNTHLRGRRDPGEPAANAVFIVKSVNSHDALKSSLAEMVGIYWGDGDGHEPPPQCIQRAMAALASIKEAV